MPSSNIIMLQTVANGLGELKEEMVFVGGEFEIYFEEFENFKSTLHIKSLLSKLHIQDS
jgi:hypothetical protein